MRTGNVNAGGVFPAGIFFTRPSVVVYRLLSFFFLPYTPPFSSAIFFVTLCQVMPVSLSPNGM